MLSIYLTIILFAFSNATEKPYYNLEHAEEYFQEFIKNHGKSYQHDLEKQQRFDIFKNNLIRLNYLNRVTGTVHGINQFTDMMQEEFSELHNSCIVTPEERFGQSFCRVITDADLMNVQAPPLLDYRQKNAVSNVKNQGRCFVCYAFATVGSLEAMYALRYRKLLSLSTQQLMDCLRSSRHCQPGGGSMTTTFSELMMTAGVESEIDYPYVAGDLRCQFQPSKAVLRVTGCYNFQLRSEEKLKQALVRYGPIAIGINSEPLNTHFSGIVDAAHCPPGKIGHAVLLVGYGTDPIGRDYWIIKNSWGTAWGEQGYVRFLRGQNVCGMLNILAASGEIA